MVVMTMDFSTCNLCIVIALFTFASAQKFEGQTCFNDHHNASGTCKVISECEVAKEDLKTSISPQNCGFNGDTPIICCTDKIVTITKSAEVTGKITSEKCKEYTTMRNNFDKEIIQYYYSTKVNSTSITKQKRESQQNDDKVRYIAGGFFAKRFEFPYMAAIGYISKDEGVIYGCGASLISEKYLLSAAHCSFHRDHGAAKVAKLGAISLVADEVALNTTEYKIVKIINHPDYSPPSTYNDISLMELEKTVQFTRANLPICLYTKTEFDYDVAQAAGWGRTGFFEDPSNFLMAVNLNIFNTSECTERYKPSARRLKIGIDEDTQLCAGSLTEAKDTCSGDSGGPLQIYHDLAYRLVGITSFGSACGIGKSLGIYTRVSNYISWIEENVWL